MTRCWSTTLEGQTRSPINGVDALGQEHLFVTLSESRFKVLTWDGEWIYSYEGELLAAQDPKLTTRDYITYAVQPSVDGSRIYLLNRTQRLAFIDLETGLFTQSVTSQKKPDEEALFSNRIVHDRLLYLTQAG